MIRPIMKDEVFLAQKSVPATKADLPVVEDLIDTLRANLDGCVGMAANMIGVKKCVVEYLDKDFKKQKGTFTGFVAQIIQHEIDHCNGIII